MYEEGEIREPSTAITIASSVSVGVSDPDTINQDNVVHDDDNDQKSNKLFPFPYKETSTPGEYDFSNEYIFFASKATPNMDYDWFTEPPLNHTWLYNDETNGYYDFEGKTNMIFDENGQETQVQEGSTIWYVSSIPHKGQKYILKKLNGKWTDPPDFGGGRWHVETPDKSESSNYILSYNFKKSVKTRMFVFIIL